MTQFGLIELVNEFGIKAVANHCADVHREEVFGSLKPASIPVVYGPMDSFPYKVESNMKVGGTWKS